MVHVQKSPFLIQPGFQVLGKELAARFKLGGVVSRVQSNCLIRRTLLFNNSLTTVSDGTATYSAAHFR